MNNVPSFPSGDHAEYLTHDFGTRFLNIGEDKKAMPGENAPPAMGNSGGHKISVVTPNPHEKESLGSLSRSSSYDSLLGIGEDDIISIDGAHLLPEIVHTINMPEASANPLPKPSSASSMESFVSSLTSDSAPPFQPSSESLKRKRAETPSSQSSGVLREDQQSEAYKNQAAIEQQAINDFVEAKKDPRLSDAEANYIAGKKAAQTVFDSMPRSMFTTQAIKEAKLAAYFALRVSSPLKAATPSREAEKIKNMIVNEITDQKGGKSTSSSSQK